VPNFAAITQTVAEIWRFFDFFENGGRRHVGFLIFLKISTVGTLKRVKLRNHAKCRGQRPNQCDSREM